ncbi:hypothetical protein VZ95_01900 [Elstera litoralis]|uniref:Integral membrane protein n=1 Tax=Elstera litoralis TaxID=552518 RepID=A0A0F3IW40_9PROT|nr:anthrone oxygenase family protein [Elstera litoralis]KJV10911.1 hypothetical protein VZ95_01900 [Elstera litoralis]
MIAARPTPLLWGLSLTSLLLMGAIAGFFYAYACSVMVGLAAVDAGTAIRAMQGINATVRNVYFAPAFFGPPVVALLTAWAAYRQGRSVMGRWFVAAALVYGLGGLLLTIRINVPMNAALALLAVPTDPAEAARIWAAYAEPWRFWNLMRTLASFAALACCGIGISFLQSAPRAEAA